eukprot:CAMPEP_0195632932 /NCGR_PEP_ID=MMETSP0815-20121206/21862_1 /TAXON_ID=97485 /ORGANISM="Prymnesium parvum, Strain Texoma1" /LENGTH=135 /DNA_ID=CAMNT_0040774533 /DNA_START=414 /DNA_END=821 /DNA_ORIENTATION=-
MAQDGKINMPDDEVVHWDVPKAPVLLKIVGVPPCLIELTVAKAQQLCKHVEPDVKEEVEATEPYASCRYGELEHSFKDAQQVTLPHGCGRVLEERHHVLRDECGDEGAKDDEANQEGEEVCPAHTRRAREGDLIA